MEEHKKRMLVEMEGLSDNIEKLGNFIKGSEIYKNLNDEDKFLLRCQKVFMEHYRTILGYRLDGKINSTFYEAMKTIGLDINEIDNISEEDFKIKLMGVGLVKTINEEGYDERRKSIAKTNVETGVMYGVKSIHKH